jgi:hypothetical protein
MEVEMHQVFAVLVLLAQNHKDSEIITVLTGHVQHSFRQSDQSARLFKCVVEFTDTMTVFGVVRDFLIG